LVLVTSWDNLDAAFNDVAVGIRSAMPGRNSRDRTQPTE